MTTKTKVKVSIAIIAVTVIMVVVAIAGICLSLNRSYYFKGKVSFVSTDVNATITKASIGGGVLIGENMMQQLEVDGLISDIENINTWEGLDFEISKGSQDIVIRFDIINHSTDKTLKIELGEINANLTNASVTMRFDGQEVDEKTAYVKRAKTDQLGEVIEESFKEVVVTIHVNNKKKDASVTDFNLPIILKNINGYVVNINNQSEEVNANTMVYTDNNSEKVLLHENLAVCGNLVTIVNDSEYDFKYSIKTNNGATNTYEIKSGMHLVLAFNKDSNVVITSVIKVN